MSFTPPKPYADAFKLPYDGEIAAMDASIGVLLKDPDLFVRREAVAAMDKAGDSSRIPQIEPKARASSATRPGRATLSTISTRMATFHSAVVAVPHAASPLQRAGPAVFQSKSEH